MLTKILVTMRKHDSEIRCLESKTSNYTFNKAYPAYTVVLPYLISMRRDIYNNIRNAIGSQIKFELLEGNTDGSN